MDDSLRAGEIYTYETIVIFDTDNYKEHAKIIKDMCQRFTGTKHKIKEERLGVKTLAYKIKKHTEGYYVLFTWQGTIENVNELERCMRINDNVLKFITVKIQDAEDELQEFSTSEKSEQDSYNPNTQVDALDVILGFADYTKKGV